MAHGKLPTTAGSHSEFTEVETTHIYKALESLRNEVIARDDARGELMTAQFTAVNDRLSDISEHLRTLNGRTRKSENEIGKMKTVIALITSVSVIVFGGVVTYIFSHLH